MKNIRNLVSILRDVENSAMGQNDPATRADYIGSMLGSLLAKMAQLPTSPVDHLINHYFMNLEPEIKRTLSEINEQHIFNVKLAIQTARAVYLARYRMVYDTTLILSELPLIYPDHVAVLPQEVKKVFAGMSETMKHSCAKYLAIAEEL